MNLELQIPEEVALLLTSEYADLPRAAVEALALEGYRSKRFSEGQVRRMLGFSSWMQVHAFLKEHGVYLHYSLEDLDQDRETSRELNNNSSQRCSRSIRRKRTWLDRLDTLKTSTRNRRR